MYPNYMPLSNTLYFYILSYIPTNAYSCWGKILDAFDMQALLEQHQEDEKMEKEPWPKDLFYLDVFSWWFFTDSTMVNHH